MSTCRHLFPSHEFVCAAVGLGLLASSLVATGCGDGRGDGQRAQTSITVVEATYGANAGATRGNATKDVASTCNGKQSCQYVVDYQKLGDPVPGVAKDFIVLYPCDGADSKRATVPSEAGDAGFFRNHRPELPITDVDKTRAEGAQASEESAELHGRLGRVALVAICCGRGPAAAAQRGGRASPARSRRG
jgi:hypothetical protein